MKKQSITINKSVEGELEVNVYAVICDCGAELDFDLDAYNDGDLRITVREHECVQKEQSSVSDDS